MLDKNALSKYFFRLHVVIKGMIRQLERITYGRLWNLHINRNEVHIRGITALGRKVAVCQRRVAKTFLNKFNNFYCQPVITVALISEIISIFFFSVITNNITKITKQYDFFAGVHVKRLQLSRKYCQGYSKIRKHYKGKCSREIFYLNILYLLSHFQTYFFV